MLYDKDIREPLFDFLEETYGKIRIFEEKMTGRSRADVVMVTESGLYGIEIKSDADTYIRLAGQIKNYNIYYDYNYVVVGSSHASHIEEHVPEFWGIIIVEEDGAKVDFYILRKPKSNPEVDNRLKLSILWRPELAHIQSINEMAAYKQKSKMFVVDKIIEKVSPDLLQRQMMEELFERDYSTIADVINDFRTANGKRKRRRKKKY